MIGWAIGTLLGVAISIMLRERRPRWNGSTWENVRPREWAAGPSPPPRPDASYRTPALASDPCPTCGHREKQT